MNTILIIDDQVKRLANLQRIIEEKFEKCTVLTAPGGAKGFEIARRKKPDAILIDTQIADIDAYQLCGQIKADQLTCSVPVLLITDLKTNPECGGKIIESGADTALSRPFDPIEVFLQLRLLFRIKEKKDHLQGTPEAVESELLQSREQYKSDYDRYRLMADNSPDMMWAKDMEGRFTFTNKAICDNLLNAKDVNEPIGKDVMFFVDRERKEHPENLRWFTFGEDCADSDSVTIEKRQTCRFDEYGNVFGKYLFLDVYKTPLWNEHGEMTGTVGNARIVTKEREVEKALKESEEMLRNILENSTNLFYSHTVDHVITYLSPQVEEILGYTQEEALVRWTHLASDNLLNEKGFQHTERAIKTGERQPPYELELLKKGGDKIWVEVREFPQLDGGVAKSIIGSLTEITERKHTEHIREVIFNISKASLSSLNLEKLMAYIRIELGTIIDTSNFFIALKDKDNDRITLPFFDDEKDHLSILPEGKTLTNYVISTDKPLLVDSFEKKKMTADGKIELFGSLSKKWLGVPLRLENEVIGVLAVQSYTDENAYDDADMKML